MIKTVFSKCAKAQDELPRLKYATDASAAQDRRNVYFPDALIDAFVQEGCTAASKTFSCHALRTGDPDLMVGSTITEPHISPEEAKALIVDSLTAFHPELGRRSSDILNDPARLNLHIVAVGEGGMMRARPAGLKLDPDDKMRLENAGLPTEFVRGLRTRYPDDENTKSDTAVIDFDYDGTVAAVVYLAHELGHALADESQLKAGHSFRDNPVHMQEVQAYVVQHIVLDQLREHSDPSIRAAATSQFSSDMTKNLYAFPLAAAANDALDAARDNREINPARVLDQRFGENWELFVQQHTPGQKVFDTIAALQGSSAAHRPQLLQVLNDEVSRLHSRPMSIMVGSAIASHLLTQDLQTRADVMDATFGGRGPKSIEAVLRKVAIGPFEFSAVAKKTLQHATASVSEQNAVPAGCVSKAHKSDARDKRSP